MNVIFIDQFLYIKIIKYCLTQFYQLKKRAIHTQPLQILLIKVLKMATSEIFAKHFCVGKTSL